MFGIRGARPLDTSRCAVPARLLNPSGGKMEPVGKDTDECGPVVYIDYARFELREYKSTSVLTTAELQRCVAVDWMVDRTKDGMTPSTRELVVGGRPALISSVEGAADPQVLVFPTRGRARQSQRLEPHPGGGTHHNGGEPGAGQLKSPLPYALAAACARIGGASHP